MKIKGKLLAIIISVMMLISTVTVYAAGSIKPNKSSMSIAVGSSSTLTITASNAAGRIDVSSSNPGVATITSGAGKHWLDKDSVTLTIKAVSEGTCTIDIKLTDAATYDDEDLSGKTIRVTVNVYTPKPVVSNDATLKLLEVAGLSLSPEFTSGNTEYTVYAPLDTTNLDITAVANHPKATVSPIDESVSEGWNKTDITVTAEDGTKKVYTLNTYVEEMPTKIYDFEDTQQGVVVNLDNVTLDEFEKGDDGIFTGKGVDVIYCMDMATREKDFFILDRENDVLIARYRTLTICCREYIVGLTDYENNDLDPMVVGKITIDGVELDGWVYVDEDMKHLSVVVLKDEEGVDTLYRYDAIEDMVVRYAEPAEVEPEASTNPLLLPLAGTGLLSLILAMLLLAERKKNKEENV